ncbi:MAG: DUF3419 family protein [Planctomycetes bacterium]|nr:DUF3419 family protein [Planctomycetota bacterium]MCC7169061.1 DUF3419 family protein [Planctomycetota bacterium]
MPLLQFATVREDPLVELALLRERPTRHALMIASAGDTALALRAHLPDLELTLVEPNPAQKAHVLAKEAAWLAAEPPSVFNVGAADPSGLSERGNFEALFRQLRSFLREFVAPASTFEAWFGERGALAASAPAVFAQRYWPVAFQLFFADSMLHAMFGPAATQHARPGSYPDYFRRVIERGLLRDDAFDNPYLQHVLSGRYMERRESWPEFLRLAPQPLRATWIDGTLDTVPSFAPFDFVDLSNVLDWSDRAQIDALASRLGHELRPSARVLWRQLNDPEDLEARFAPWFTFDATRAAALLASERSLFYDSLHLGTRVADPRPNAGGMA